MMTEYVRKMASIQEVNGVFPIAGADKICQYGIQGWKVVDQVGKYQVGDKVIYFEIDSFLPTELAPFLSKGKEPREYNGVRGEKLRTIKLRGALSQGLILPIEPTCDMIVSELLIGLDVSFPLGVQKWEPPPEFKSADAKGSFPAFLRKSDQERIQTCYSDVVETFDQVTYQVTEKMEGQSLTAYFYNGEFGVCSRNLNLRDADNTFWNTARKYGLQEKLEKLSRNIAIQFEQCGPSISGNIYNMKEYFLFAYDIFDIDKQEFMSPFETQQLIKELDLVSVPIIESECNLQDMTIDSMLAKADGYSVIGTSGCRREGLVFKANCRRRISFKSVSNLYLLGEK